MTFRFFPDIHLELAEGAIYVWKPEAYLYRRGNTNYYCLTFYPDDPLVAEDELDKMISSLQRRDAVEKQNFHALFRAEHTIDSTFEDHVHSNVTKQTDTLSRALQEGNGMEMIVLGSSFFINHDIIFSLGNWSLGFIRASCPSTHLKHRK